MPGGFDYDFYHTRDAINDMYKMMDEDEYYGQFKDRSVGEALLAEQREAAFSFLSNVHVYIENIRKSDEDHYIIGDIYAEGTDKKVGDISLTNKGILRVRTLALSSDYDKSFVFNMRGQGVLSKTSISGELVYDGTSLTFFDDMMRDSVTMQQYKWSSDKLLDRMHDLFETHRYVRQTKEETRGM